MFFLLTSSEIIAGWTGSFDDYKNDSYEFYQELEKFSIITGRTYPPKYKVYGNEPGIFYAEGFPYIARALYQQLLISAGTDKKRVMTLTALAIVSRKLCAPDDERRYIKELKEIVPNNQWVDRFTSVELPQDCKPPEPTRISAEYQIPTYYKEDMDSIPEILAIGNKPLTKPMRFFTVPSCSGNSVMCATPYILAIGTITDDTPEKFLRHYEKNPAPIIAFHSPGGDHHAGIRLGFSIRKRKLKTIVGDDESTVGAYHSYLIAYKENPPTKLHFESMIIQEPICLSACAYAFLGGTERYISKSGKYGVHQFNASGEMDENVAQSIVGRLHIYLSSMGVDRDLLEPVLRTEPGDLKLLNPQQLERLKITTGRSFTNPAWKLIASDEGVISARVAATDRYYTDREITIQISRNGAIFNGVLTYPLQESTIKQKEYLSQCLEAVKYEGENDGFILEISDENQESSYLKDLSDSGFYSYPLNNQTIKDNQRYAIPFTAKINDQGLMTFNFQLSRSMVEAMAISDHPVKSIYYPVRACTPFEFHVKGFSSEGQRSTLKALLRD